jgi:hypothetical protein
VTVDDGLLTLLTLLILLTVLLLLFRVIEADPAIGGRAEGGSAGVLERR